MWLIVDVVGVKRGGVESDGRGWNWHTILAILETDEILKSRSIQGSERLSRGGHLGGHFEYSNMSIQFNSIELRSLACPVRGSSDKSRSRVNSMEEGGR
jgi:hypothetical protein